MSIYKDFTIKSGSSPVTLNNATFTGSAKVSDAVLNLKGVDSNLGTFTTAGAGSHINIQYMLTNKGSMSFTKNGYASNYLSGGTFVNNGTVNVEGFAQINSKTTGTGNFSFAVPDRPTGTYIVPDDVTGQNTLGYDSPNTIDFESAVASTQTIDCANDALIILGDLRNFHGQVKNFTHFNSHTLDLFEVRGNISSTSYSGGTTHGALKLYSGTTLAGTINMVGDYTHRGFAVSHPTGTSMIQTYNLIG